MRGRNKKDEDSVRTESCIGDTIISIDTNGKVILEGNYEYDLNLNELDIVIRKYLHKKATIVSDKEKLRELETLKSRLKEGVEVNTRKACIRRIREIECNCDLVAEYTEDTREILSNYSRIGPIPTIISFTVEKKKIKEPEERVRLRTQLILDYLCLLGKYVTVNLMCSNKISEDCPYCGADKSMVLMDESNTYCSTCGMERSPVTPAGTMLQDVTKKTSVGRSSYEDRENFMKAIAKFQGKKTPENIDGLKEALDRRFSVLKVPTKEQAALLDLDAKGRKNGTSKKLMYDALKETGYPNYEDINYICHMYWGWELPDISQYEDQLLSDYDKAQVVYKEVRGTRKSSSNSQYRLFRHLHKIGYPVDPSDFKIVKASSLDFHEEFWQRACDTHDWQFIPISLLSMDNA